MKFGRYYCSRDVNVGKERRDKWVAYAEEINDFTPIVPIIEKNQLDKWSLVPVNNAVSRNFNRINGIIEEWKDNLKKAEMRKETQIREQRKADKKLRQTAIDVENAQIRKEYEMKLEERNKAIDEEKKRANNVTLVEVLTNECLPRRGAPDRQFKVLEPKYKFIGVYDNGAKRTIKHIKSVVGPTDDLFCVEFDTGEYPKFKDQGWDWDFNPGRVEKFYFEKYLKLGDNAINSRIDIPMPTKPQYIEDAKTEKTSIWKMSLDSDLDPIRVIKKAKPDTAEMVEATNAITEWQKAKKTAIKMIAKVYDETNKDTGVNHNRFSVLKLHNSSWNLHKYVKNEKDKISQVPVGLKTDVKSDRIYDTVTEVQWFKKGEPMKKRDIKKRKQEMRDIKAKNKKFKTVNVEKRLTFREVVLMIVNSRLLEEVKISNEKILQDPAIDEFLEKGFLTRKTTGLNKSHRAVATRIIRSFYCEIFE